MIRNALASAVARSILATAVVCAMLPETSRADDFLELLRSDLKADKVALLTEVMEFTPEQADVFWPIYREYDLELSKIGDARIAVLKEYAANFESLTPAKTKELMDRSFKLEANRLDLLKTYYRKVEKALSPIEAARFVQAERQIQMLIDVQIAEQVPLVQKPAE